MSVLVIRCIERFDALNDRFRTLRNENTADEPEYLQADESPSSSIDVSSFRIVGGIGSTPDHISSATTAKLTSQHGQKYER